MPGFFKVAIPSFILGAGVGAFGWYAFSPLLFDDVVAEELVTAQVLASGSFSDADRAHQGRGTATLARRPDGVIEVQFTDFEVTNGPDLEVWLSAHPAPASSADVKGAAFLSLGRLKGNVGDQAYPLPAGTDPGAYGSVVIWCEQFGVLFSPAPLAQAS